MRSHRRDGSSGGRGEGKGGSSCRGWSNALFSKDLLVFLPHL